MGGGKAPKKYLEEIKMEEIKRHKQRTLDNKNFKPKKLYACGWEITEDIKNKKEVKEVIEGIESRVVEICTKFEKGNVNEASLPAFFLGLQGDVDEALNKARRKK